MRVAVVLKNNPHVVEARGYPRASKVAEGQWLRRDLTPARGHLTVADRLRFGVDVCDLPNEPHAGWPGMSGSAVMLQDWSDPEDVWIYGVVQAVPAEFDRQLFVARLADAWKDLRFRNLLVAAGAADEDAEDPTDTTRLPIAPDGVAAEVFEFAVREFRDEYFCGGAGATTVVPFGGRDRELSCLDMWLDDRAAEPRFVLAAPSGRGKSALLAHWLRNLKEASRISETGPKWRLVFVPISMRFETNRPELFYEAIAARLAKIVGEPLPPRSASSAVYKASCKELLRKAIAGKLKTLLVIDGIDEALGGSFDASWFPRDPGASMRLLVLARLQVGDQDARGWIRRLYWDDLPVRALELPTIDLDGVRDLLRRNKATEYIVAFRPELVEKLYELTDNGDPLLLRLYVEDLSRRPDDSDRLQLDELKYSKNGLSGFFDRWWDLQRKAWASERKEGATIDEPTLEAYLRVLACAYGPLRARELGDLARRLHDIPPTSRTENALHALRRFVVGQDRQPGPERVGFVLSHSRFGEFLREDYFDTHVVEQTQLAFAAWGRCVLRQVNERKLPPDSVPPYLLQHMGEHLKDAGAPPTEFMGLVEEGWWRAWKAFEGGHHGYVRDVRLSLQKLADAVKDSTLLPAAGPSVPFFGERVKCALALISALQVT